MARVRNPCALPLALLLVLAPVSAARAQRGPRGLSQPELRRMVQRAADMVALALDERVPKDLSLNEEQAATLKKVGEKLSAEMREQFGRLSEIDEKQQPAKTAQWAKEFRRKARTQLRGLLAREQLMRLDQIRLQRRGALEVPPPRRRRSAREDGPVNARASPIADGSGQAGPQALDRRAETAVRSVEGGEV